MAAYLPRILCFLAAVCFMQCTAKLTYLFTAPEYILQESGTADTATVIVQRTSDIPGDTTETAVQSSIYLDFECNEGCPSMAGADQATLNTDFSLNARTIVFAPNVLQQPVIITVADDGINEMREYFCLSVSDATMRGSQWSTRVVIPWNGGECIRHTSIPDGGTTQTSPGYFLDQPNSYIGPWDTANVNTITFTLTPQETTVNNAAGTVLGDGNDFAIFLATEADPASATLNYYGMLLDDANAATDATHAGTAAFSSYFIKDDIATLIGTENTADDLVIADMTNEFELTYNSGTITLTRTSPTPITMTVSDSAAYDVQHLFVSAALDKYATWEICGIEPMKIAIESATASDFHSDFDADKVKDGVLDPYSCFISDVDDGTDKWLQIDLGREYEVSQIVIFPVADVSTGLANHAWLNNAQVYVGSCRSDNITSNHLCTDALGNTDIGDVTGPPQVEIIEAQCSGTNVYGRYVYIVPATSTAQFALCDVMVFGSEVPADMATKLSFTLSTSEVAETAGTATLGLTRTGPGRTCTYVDYYTDTSSGDFTAISATSATEVKIGGGTADTQTETVAVTIIDDEVCESTESFNVHLTDVEGGQLDGICTSTVQLTDDDALTYSVSVGANSVSEGNSFDISVTRSGTVMQDGSATLTFTDGTATSADYSVATRRVEFTPTSDNTQTVTVSVTDDQCYEGSQTFQVNVDTASLSPSCSGVAAGLPITFTIVDNDSDFLFSESDGELEFTESAGSREISIIRTGSTAQSKTIEIEIDYDGTTEDDFTITPENRMVTFDPGDSSESITLSITDDSTPEDSDETFYLTIKDNNGDDCPNGNRGDPYQLRVTLQDNDWTYDFRSSSYSVVESEGHTIVCLVRDGNANTAETVQITSTGITATSDVDFQPLTYVTFGTTDTEVCVQAQIIGDQLIEDDETFTLSIASDQGYNVGSQGTITITVIDDDAVIGFADASYEFTEGETALVYITKEGDLEVRASVTATAGTASSDDFTNISGDITIPASATTYALRIPLTDDNEAEPSESFALTLQASTTGEVLVGATTVTILDNDGFTGTTAAPGPDGGDGRLGGGAIAGIIVALLLGMLALGITCCACYYYGLCATLLRPNPVAREIVNVEPSPMQVVPLAYSYGNAYGVNNGYYSRYNGLGYGLQTAPMGAYSYYSNYI